MDNRLRFLYPVASEMWGHRHKAGAGNGKPSASAGARREANPPRGGGGVKRSEERVAKPAEWLSGKAAIECHGPVP